MILFVALAALRRKRPAPSSVAPGWGHFISGDHMENQKQFVDGLMAKKPRDTAPDWIKCNISIKREELAAWLAGQTDEWINVQVCESKNGKWYAEVDTWKPKSA